MRALLIPFVDRSSRLRAGTGATPLRLPFILKILIRLVSCLFGRAQGPRPYVFIFASSIRVRFSHLNFRIRHAALAALPRVRRDNLGGLAFDLSDVAEQSRLHAVCDRAVAFIANEIA